MDHHQPSNNPQIISSIYPFYCHSPFGCEQLTDTSAAASPVPCHHRPQARNTIRPGDQLAIAEHLNITCTIYITINHVEPLQWFILSRPFTPLLLVIWCWGRAGRVERLLSSASAALVWKVRPSPGALSPCCRWPCVALDRRRQRGRGDVATYQSIMEVIIATSL